MTGRDPLEHPYEPGQAPVAAAPVASAPDRSAGHGLLIATLVLLIIDLYLMAGVVPKFKAMFDALKGELPFLTQLVLTLSNYVTDYLVIVVVGVGVLTLVAFRHAARIPLAVHVVLLTVLSGTLLVTPVAIFYPIMQLQSAIRGDPPPDQQPDRSGSP